MTTEIERTTDGVAVAHRYRDGLGGRDLVVEGPSGSDVGAAVAGLGDAVVGVRDSRDPDAFSVVDDVLRQGVQGISELITVPGLINVDFADVKAIMSGSGSALMGIGRGSGENRAIDAAKAAIDSPLLEMSIDGARGILFTITGSSDLGMYEINEAAKIITGAADEDAKVIFGAVINDDMKDEVKITVVATGFEGTSRARERENAAAATRVRDLESMEELDRKRAVFFERESGPGSGSGGTLSRDGGEEREAGSADDQEALEIPAFIRKKMH